jgi:hypothetical protein
MQYLLGAVLLVCGLIGGLIYINSDLPESEGQTVDGELVSSYQQLPEIDLPDYANVVADEARRAELENEAAAFLDGLAHSDRSSDSSNSNAISPREFSFVDSVDALLVKGQDHVQVENHSVPLAEIMRSAGKPIDRGSYYFMHKVTESDAQGIWGVIQADLMRRFADGVAISRGEDSQQYHILIPKNADEKLDNGQSSFLGKVLYHKSQRSVIYNTWAGERRFGLDDILPEQDVVIIDFTREELIGIYQYFVTQAQ